MNSKTIVAVAIALTGALGAGLAQARTDVQWSVSLGLPLPPLPFVVVRPAPVYQPAPVYAQPAPVYVEPAPVYYESPVYYGAPVYYGGPVYGRPVPVYSRPQPTRWDVDGDGIPNRYDRYDNRYEHRHHDRHHDGGTDRYERHSDPRWGR